MTPHTAPATSATPNDVLSWILRLRAISDIEFASMVGLTRQSIYNKRAKGRSITAAELGDMAEALDVPVALFFHEPIDVVRWAIENRPEWFSTSDDKEGATRTVQRSAQSRCTAPSVAKITGFATVADDPALSAILAQADTSSWHPVGRSLPSDQPMAA